ncbi:insulin-like growth factor-binding protein 6a [Triplophysa rosa]|uniref:Insulin-like growth factor binding protein 6a n=1 Tax=Triplophysa rosa TaxID=992332 RepID=A0A9W7TBF2_TRIRA|nr:insulin-like growth factor-binding protein 6a [Triplophysa rosa]KAI7795430.1 insulin-like growth factor binding protein 6a precursor [Triplophysa rosa]
MFFLHDLLIIFVPVLCLFSSNYFALGLGNGCKELCNGSSGSLKSHIAERLTGEVSTSILALDEPCGVYTLPCAPGLRCIPPLGEQGPLQALLQGRGLCKNIKSTITDVSPPTDYRPSTADNTEKGPCRKLLNTVLQGIELTVIHSIQNIYIPNCDRHGFFRKKQCRSSRGMQRGHCWCVDEKGAKIISRKKEDGTISCTST